MTRRNPLASCRTLSVAAGLLAAAIAAFVAAPAANSEILQLSATAFVPRGTASQGQVGSGMLQNATGKYYATVPFPAGGMRVCSFSLWYYDNDIDWDITARLLRKGVVVGGSAFAAPVVMAQVTSAGAVNTMQRVSDTTITNPVISPGVAIYYIDLNIPYIALQIAGVQIEHKPTCP